MSSTFPTQQRPERTDRILAVSKLLSIGRDPEVESDFMMSWRPRGSVGAMVDETTEAVGRDTRER